MKLPKLVCWTNSDGGSYVNTVGTENLTKAQAAEVIRRAEAYQKMKDVLESMVMSCQDCEFFGEVECEYQTECLNKKASQALAGEPKE